MKLRLTLTERCMANCPGCKASLDWWRSKARSGLYPSDIDLRLAKRILDEAAAAGWGSCVLSGGETTSYRDLVEVVRYATGLGLRTKINTNGWRLTPDYLQDLLDAGLTTVMLSVYSLDRRRFQRLRDSPGLYERALAAADNLSDILSRHPDAIEVKIQTIISRINFRDLPELLRMVLDRGFHSLATSYLENAISYPELRMTVAEIEAFLSEVVPELQRIITDSEIDGLRKEKALAQSRRFFSTEENTLENYSAGIYRPDGQADCGLRDRFAAVSPDGTVSPCCAFQQIRAPEFVVDLKELSLTQAMDSSQFGDFWSEPFYFCRYCPIDKHVWIRVRSRPRVAHTPLEPPAEIASATSVNPGAGALGDS